MGPSGRENYNSEGKIPGFTPHLTQQKQQAAGVFRVPEEEMVIKRCIGTGYRIGGRIIRIWIRQKPPMLLVLPPGIENFSRWKERAGAISYSVDI
jgi:hypothetical protein